MKTLDDALSTPGGIPYGTYSLSDLSPIGVSGYIGSESGISVVIKGVFHFSELRRIADHLDPQPDKLAAVRAEARREALEEAAKAAENVYVVIDKDEYGETRKHGSGMEAAAAIRALIDRPAGEDTALASFAEVWRDRP